MARKLAIVLRGAPGTGKTTILNALRQHYGLSKTSQARLDNEWGPGESRFDGRDRYRDLRDQPEVLLIELGYGEPLGETFAGATKNPREWLSILEKDGREVFFFLLDIDKAESLRRVAARGNLSPAYTAIAWERYAPGGVCSSQAFSSRSGYAEDTIDTRKKDVPATVQHILEKINAARLAPPSNSGGSHP